VHPYRKLASVLVAIAIPLGTVAGLASSSPAWAKSHNKAASGVLSCNGTGGSITFKTPLTPNGTATEKKTTVSASFGTCTANGASVTVSKLTVKLVAAPGGLASCKAFASNTASDGLTITVKYAGGISPSTVKFAAGSITANIGVSTVGFTASGGTVTGSYAGSATFGAQLSSTSSMALISCIGGTGSVSSLQISGGSSSI